MAYELSDHYDGAHFFNPEPTIRTQGGQRGGMWRLLRARMKRDESVWSRWPKHIENMAFAPPQGEASISWIGHSTFLLRLPGLTILTDPQFSERCSPVQFAGPRRVRAPGIALADLPRIDVVLLSHNHYDHLDLNSLRALRRHAPGAQIVTTLGNTAYLGKKRLPGAIELDWWQATSLLGATITATPARHFAARTLWDRNETLWGGFYVDYQGHRIYFAGDTGYTRYFSEIRGRLGAPTLAMLPIGAYEPRWMMGPVHMNPEDAVQALIDLDATSAVGMHFGTFQLTAEPIDAPVSGLKAAMQAAGQPLERFFTLDVGESATL